MNKKCRKQVLLMLVLASVFMMCFTAAAANEGWNTQKGKISYYINSGSGLKKVTGLKQIGDYYYYFDKKGNLKTGWQNNRYFTPSGEPGVIGRMFTGLKKIGSDRFYFEEDGENIGIVYAKGIRQVGKYWYFFRKDGNAGVRGAALKNKWKKANGALRYFGKNGRMAVNTWVNNTYYVGETGKILRSFITPDGYLVNEKGKKVSTSKVKGWVEIKGKYYAWSAKKQMVLKDTWIKYQGEKFYVDKTGARVSGVYSIDGAKYYFEPKTGAMVTGEYKKGKKIYYFDPKTGKMLVNGTKDGYTTNAKGVVTKFPPAKVLVDAGHGQGDPGATSKLGQESKKTREFAKLLYTELKKKDNLDVTYLKNGSEDYDLYHQNSVVLKGTSITGTGANKKNVVKKMRKSSAIPDLTEYDYVVEVHFNATAVQNKDEGGNGSYKGFMIYVNKYKSNADRAVDKAMIQAVKDLKFKIFGSGIEKSGGLYNAKICQEVGVNYSLIETAFIDDADDMKFYNKNKKKMAKSLANAISKNIGR